MAVKGIGARRAHMIWQALDVATLHDLACAATAHRLCRLPDIGETLEAGILRELERMGVAQPALDGRLVQLPL